MLNLALGTAEWSIHVKDCHWFLLRESPTNIMLFPLNFSRKFTALNLQNKKISSHAWVDYQNQTNYWTITPKRVWKSTLKFSHGFALSTSRFYIWNIQWLHINHQDIIENFPTTFFTWLYEILNNIEDRFTYKCVYCIFLNDSPSQIRTLTHS